MHHPVIEVILWSFGGLIYRQHHGGGDAVLTVLPLHIAIRVYIRVVHPAPWWYLFTTCQLHTTWAAVTKSKRLFWRESLLVFWPRFVMASKAHHVQAGVLEVDTTLVSKLPKKDWNTGANVGGVKQKDTSDYETTQYFASYFVCSIMLTIIRSEYSTASLSESIRA